MKSININFTVQVNFTCQITITVNNNIYKNQTIKYNIDYYIFHMLTDFIV